VDDPTTGYKVRLVSVASFYDAATTSSLEQVIFKVTPQLSESRRVEYTPVTPIHMPGSIQIYKNTLSREFSLTAKLISRSSEEATQNMESMQLLRGWCMPYFGQSSTLTEEQRLYRTDQATARANQTDTRESQITPANTRAARGVELLGAPPDVLYLYAYASTEQRTPTSDRATYSGQRAINIHKVPVVITSLDFSFPDDVDYIPSLEINGISSPFPTRMEVRLSLAETHSPSEYQRFNLADFKTGRLVNF
jgi:hypothetical protein